MNGWIKIHRRLLGWEHFKEPSVVTVYLTLLLSADRDGKTDINMGGLISVTGLSHNTVAKAIAKLVKSGEISREKYGNKITTTIIKWSELQVKNSLTQKLGEYQEPLTQKLGECEDSLTQKLGGHTPKNWDNIDPKIGIIQYNKNVEESNKNILVDDARARVREEVMTDAMVERGCMSLGIDRATYENLAYQVFTDWDFQDLPDTEWTKAHFLAVMRYKVKDLKNGHDKQTGDSGDPNTKLAQDALKAMAAFAPQSRQPAEPTW